MEERTDVTRVRHPALLSYLPFHLGNLCPIRSMRGWTWIFCSDLMWSCSPKYLHGKLPLVSVKGERTWSRCTFVQLIGCTKLFCRLIWRPENVPNVSSMDLTASTSSFVGLMKMAASSAYIEVLHFAAVICKGVSIPCWVAWSSKR